MRARGLLPPKDPHQIDAAFPDVPDAFDRYERMFRFNQLPRERRNDWFPRSDHPPSVASCANSRAASPLHRLFSGGCLPPHVSNVRTTGSRRGYHFPSGNNPESAGENVSKLFSRPVKHSPSTGSRAAALVWIPICFQTRSGSQMECQC
jgi:hypothetical protein